MTRSIAASTGWRLRRSKPSTISSLGRSEARLGHDGAKLRVDTTMVETNIHHPTDNTLLWDVVRVLTRRVRRLVKALKLRRMKGFRDCRRAAHRRMYEIERMTTRQRQAARSPQLIAYRALIEIAEEMVSERQDCAR